MTKQQAKGGSFFDKLCGGCLASNKKAQTNGAPTAQSRQPPLFEQREVSLNAGRKNEGKFERMPTDEDKNQASKTAGSSNDSQPNDEKSRLGANKNSGLEINLRECIDEQELTIGAADAEDINELPHQTQESHRGAQIPNYTHKLANKQSLKLSPEDEAIRNLFQKNEPLQLGYQQSLWSNNESVVGAPHMHSGIQDSFQFGNNDVSVTQVTQMVGAQSFINHGPRFGQRKMSPIKARTFGLKQVNLETANSDDLSILGVQYEQNILGVKQEPNQFKIKLNDSQDLLLDRQAPKTQRQCSSSNNKGVKTYDMESVKQEILPQNNHRSNTEGDFVSVNPSQVNSGYEDKQLNALQQFVQENKVVQDQKNDAGRNFKAPLDYSMHSKDYSGYGEEAANEKLFQQTANFKSLGLNSQVNSESPPIGQKTQDLTQESSQLQDKHGASEDVCIRTFGLKPSGLQGDLSSQENEPINEVILDHDSLSGKENQYEISATEQEFVKNQIRRPSTENEEAEKNE